MLYDAVCHANLQSVMRYLYPICIRGIVKNDIRVYLYPQISIRGPISAHLWFESWCVAKSDGICKYLSCL